MLKTIRKGDSGPEVLAAKCLLCMEEVNSDFDEALTEKVKAFQTAHTTSPDGVIGPATWTALSAQLPTVSTKRNRYGSYAMAAQLLLGGDLKADGIFGAKSKAAAMAFQAAQGLSADGVIGPKTWAALITGGAPKDQPAGGQQPPDFKQYDSRWASKIYSNHGDKSQTMRSSGCGPTAMADIVAAWWDKSITPYDLAQKAVSWGCRTNNSGTAVSFFSKIASLYKATYFSTKSIDNALSCLKQGGLVVVCFGPGTPGKSSYRRWTKGGHYCCIWGFDGTNFLINDPASSSAKRAKGTRAEVLDARKGFYCFRKD